MSLLPCHRRDFHKLTMAAFGGLLAGSAIGCGDDKKGKTGGGKTGAQGSDTQGPDGTGKTKLTEAQEVMLKEPHVCRGLTACKVTGAGKENACAGQGTCATAAAHDCSGMNECKGQGGCGETAGRNACKGQGECAVPLSDKTWQKARPAFEQAMKAGGKTFGGAPKKKA